MWANLDKTLFLGILYFSEFKFWFVVIIITLEGIEKTKIEKMKQNSLNNHEAVYKLNEWLLISLNEVHQAKLARNYKLLVFSKIRKMLFHS